MDQLFKECMQEAREHLAKAESSFQRDDEKETMQELRYAQQSILQCANIEGMRTALKKLAERDDA